MRDFLTAIQSNLFLFDGGFGTQLQKYNLPSGQVPEMWNLEKPQVIEQVHREYVEAGAMAVTTNSFGGSPFKLKCSDKDLCVRINKAAAENARRAAGEKVYVAGSVGPTGAILMMGDISEQEMYDGFKIQIQGLRDGGADIVIIETMSDLQEAIIALCAAKEFDLPIILSMTFEPGNRGFRTMMGIDIQTFVREAGENGADVVATNCGTGIEKAIEITREMRRNTELPILCEPNAGLPRVQDGQTVYLETPSTMAVLIPQLIEAGAGLVGGCCGTTPEHIRLFKLKLFS
ncbi:homocysteine S-methyltransferase family protein [candidate division KSB1 bacterium]|nr:homocysteine S-methyltransferase family protein [candidate division KSB1 bacterium]